ncbi:hypothetical protein [Salinigranum sp. GCM10025319]|uniref:hypothetical protein n=1 Tax=Salinigranum sp. GCM10025319 TaxID=3252687 RepID=UPI003621922F
MIAPRLSERVSAALPPLIAVGLTSFWIAEFVVATLDAVAPLLAEVIGPRALVSSFVDFGAVVPALIGAGGWLCRPPTGVAGM